MCYVADTNYISYGDWELTLPRLENKPNVIYRLHAHKIILPYNWKRVTSTTKTITYIHQNGTTHVWQLTEGNYTIINLIKELTTLFGNDLDFEFNYITSRFVFTNHSVGQSFTLSTTAYEMLGFSDSNPVTVAAQSSYTTPNPVDLRPSPIIELRTDVTTASQEVTSGGVIANSQILCAIGMDVPPYSHKIFYDLAGEFFTEIGNETRAIRFKLTDPNGVVIEPQSSPYIVFAIDELIDDSGQLLTTQREALKLQKYALMLSSQEQMINKK